MEKPQHSTGPWFLDPKARHPWIVRAKYDDGLPGSAELFRVSYRPNAILAAAAPEMLDTLKGLRGDLAEEDSERHAQRIAVIDLAVALAEGGVDA